VRLLATWLFIGPMLSFSSFSVVAGAERNQERRVLQRLSGRIQGVTPARGDEGCLYWLNLWALFTVRNKSWVTRQVTAQT
jgi:hypothetical protein